MKRQGELWRFTRHRRGRWLNNLVEQDHRRIKRRTRPMLGFESFWTARRTLAGVEAMAMLAKGQVRVVPGHVWCTRESVILDDAALQEPFTDEPTSSYGLIECPSVCDGKCSYR